MHHNCLPLSPQEIVFSQSYILYSKHFSDEIICRNLKSRLNPNWHKGVYFYPLVVFGLNFVSRIWWKLSKLFLEVKIDINWVNLTPIDHFGSEHFGKSYFSTDVSSPEHFGTCTIWHCRRSGRWTFQHRNISTWGNFWHEEFLAQEHFGMGTFRHMDISAQ